MLRSNPSVQWSSKQVSFKLKGDGGLYTAAPFVSASGFKRKTESRANQ